MSLQIKPGNYRLMATGNECLTMKSDKENQNLTISPASPKDDQLFRIEFFKYDNTVTLQSVKRKLYVSCDAAPDAYSGIYLSRSPCRFKVEVGPKSNQRRFYFKSTYIKLYLWYDPSREGLGPPQAGLIPDNPDVVLKNWRLELIDKP